MYLERLLAVATVQSGAYSEAIRLASETARVVAAACPLFVPLAEESWTREPETYSIAKRYLQTMIDNKVDALVLGCTHYPILREVIQETVGPDVKLIDSGEATADEVAEKLKRFGLESDRQIRSGERRLCDDLDHFYVTDAADRFSRVAERFLGSPPAKLEAIELWGSDNLSGKKG